MEDTLKRVSVNGTDLAYIEQGQGEPVVLVHGSLNDLRSWASPVSMLAGRYRAIAFSRRYHWPNDPATGDVQYAVATHVADLAGLIDTLGIAPAHLVGSSYGAMTALALAATRPGYARSLVLGEPPLLPWLSGTDEGSGLLDTFMAEAWGPAGTAAERGDSESMARLFIDGVIGPGTFDHMPPPARVATLDNAAEMAAELRTPGEVYFPQLTCDDLKRVDVPVLLLDGETSPRMFRLVQDAIAPCLPDVERATIPNASHGMHIANPDGWFTTVSAFLSLH